MVDPERPPPPLDDLDRRLQAARELATPPRKGNETGSGLGAALRMSIDLLAGVGVGVALGVGFDRWLGTSPWGLIGFFVLGAAAGFRNVLRAAEQMERERHAKRPPHDDMGGSPPTAP